MYTCAVRPEIAALSAYVPGMSIAEIQEKYGLSKVVKMASNENPLGVSPLVKEALGLHAGTAFRYPQGGNPRLVAARKVLSCSTAIPASSARMLTENGRRARQ